MGLDWRGDARFQRCVTDDGFELRVGKMLDRSSYGWLVYRGQERCGGGEALMLALARHEAERLLEDHRATLTPRRSAARRVG